MRDAAALKQFVRATFADTRFPKGTPITDHECEECDEVRSDFGRKTPFALAPDFLEQHHGSLSLMSPAAFHHFLPAYLVYALDKPNSLVAMFAWFSLSPTELDDFHRDRFSRFSEEERAAVREVLEFMIERTSEVELPADERERARAYWRAA